jgi:hypothetical protein
MAVAYPNVNGNFSYNKIESGLTVVIPDGQQMIVFGQLAIDGVLEINGQVVIV